MTLLLCCDAPVWLNQVMLFAIIEECNHQGEFSNALYKKN